MGARHCGKTDDHWCNRGSSKMAVDPNWKDNIDIRKMFVGGLSADTSDESFLEYFKGYGGIEKAEIVRDQNKASRGFGFVTFENCDDLDVCLSNRPHKIDNKEIEVKRAIPKSDPNPTAHLRTKKLFIGGLREDCTKDAISEVLESISGITPKEVQLMTDRNTNKFKGFAFASFDNEDVVDKLYIIRNANICSRQVDMKKAEERGKGGSGGGGGFRGGRGGGRGGRGGGNSFGGAGYGGGGGYEGYQQTSGYGDYGSPWDYDNGYGGVYGGSYGGGYGGSYGGGSGRGYNMGQYGQESSNYGPSRGGRGRSRRGGAPYY